MLNSDQMVEDGGRERVFTLSEVTIRLQAAIREGFPDPVWVKSEIGKLNIYPGTGHCYLDLVEKQDNRTRAQVRGIIWVNDYEYITRKFRLITGEELRGGMSVLFLARVNLHPVFGLSLVIADIEPTFTLGELARERMLTIGRLKKEGIFTLNKQVEIPLVPLRIAVISAETSKGLSDFTTLLDNYPRKYNFSIRLFPAYLQGDKAVESILEQLGKIKGSTNIYDIVTIIRGGGDEIGLTCFDNYDLSREVALFPLPVLTGIGHSTNETVTEMVAGRNLITPTDLAYFILRRLDSFLENLDLNWKQIVSLARGRISEETTGLDHLHKMIRVLGPQFLRQQEWKLSMIDNRIHDLDPQHILERGYSITYAGDGTLLKSAEMARPGDTILTRLSEGALKSTVKSVNAEKK
jgi:exodeoxyribonuclease VII large subunit